MMNHLIKEFDMKQAWISLAAEKGVISESMYADLSNMPKEDRVVAVGKYLRDHPELIKVVQEAMVEARYGFLDANQLTDDQIFYVDNDSITVLETLPNKNYTTHFGQYIEFRIKNLYNLMFRLGPIDFLYYFDQNTERYRIKYANQQNMEEKHKNGFLDFLLSVAEEAVQNKGRGLDALQMLKETYCRYTRYELGADFYREFNPKSQFRLKPGGAYVYYTEIPPGGLAQVDISYNASLMMLLSQYFYAEYFKRG